jgi:uncharacterized membrane protein
MLTVLVIVLQSIGTGIKIGPLPLSLVLVPIVLGACLLGAKSGAFLGFVFGLITMIMGITGADAFSFLLFDAAPVAFIVLCLLKATLAGLGSGLIYSLLGKLFHGKKVLLQTILASVAAPIINTGVFVIGMLLCFFNTVESLPTLFPDAFGGFATPYALVFLGLAGLNFVGEFVVNLILSPAMVTILDVVKKKLHV